jgi:hypothetical protein
MNPPFSAKSWSNGLEHDYGRFEFGRPPEKNGDYAFLLHVQRPREGLFVYSRLQRHAPTDKLLRR